MNEPAGYCLGSRSVEDDHFLFVPKMLQSSLYGITTCLSSWYEAYFIVLCR